MLALLVDFRYIRYKRKLQKQTKLQKNSKKIFYFVVADAIRYPPQQKEARVMRVFFLYSVIILL